MNRPEDNDLREALRRREAQRQPATLPDDFLDRVMQGIEEQQQHHPRRRIALVAALAAAASILLLLTLHYHNHVEPTEQPVVAHAQQTALPDSAVKAEVEPYVANERDVQRPSTKRTRPMYETQAASAKQKKTAAPEPPDTLGDGIWQQKEHVLLALKMLAECEADGAQRERNAIVEAAFLSARLDGIGDASPQNLQLVVSETGDYTIVSDDQPVIIEL